MAAEARREVQRPSSAAEPFRDRQDQFTGNFDQPHLSGQFKLDGPGSSVGNLNLLGRFFNYCYNEVGKRDRVTGPDQCG
jgi:hypothetical protein